MRRGLASPKWCLSLQREAGNPLLNKCVLRYCLYVHTHTHTCVRGRNGYAHHYDNRYLTFLRHVAHTHTQKIRGDALLVARVREA